MSVADKDYFVVFTKSKYAMYNMTMKVKISKKRHEEHTYKLRNRSVKMQ